MDYFNSIERKILIKVNHDDMLLELLVRKVPSLVDDRNATLGTVYQLGRDKGVKTFEKFCDGAYKRFKPLYDSMLDYFETENYIFVHSWIPLI